MKMKFLPEAKAELDDAVEYYELQVKGLGATFDTQKSSYLSNSMD